MKCLRLTILVCTLLFSANAAAQEFATNNEATTPITELDEILLKDGNLLVGNIIDEQPDIVIFETESLGRLEIPRENIEKLAHRGLGESAVSDPDQNSIMFCPTPATLPKGDNYFRDFELLVLNFGFGVTDNFDASFSTFFPVSAELVMLTGGAKWRLMDRDVQPFGLALTGSFTKLENVTFGAIGGVIGIGNARKSLNLAINQAFDNDGNSETIFILGGDMQVSRRSKLFTEYFSSSAILDTDNLNGLINIGFRIFSRKHSFSLSGLRPLSTDAGNWIAVPMLSYSVHW